MHSQFIKDKIFSLLIIIALFGCQHKQLPKNSLSINEIPEISRFEIIPEQVIKGQQCFLQWEIKSGASIEKIEINGKSIRDSNELKASNKIIAEKTADYELVVYYKQQNQIANIRKKITLDVQEPYFKGNDSITIGDNAQIEWLVNPDAEDVFVRELIEEREHFVWEKLPKKGNYKVNPIKNTRYELNVVVGKDTLKYNHSVKVGHGFFTGTRTLLRGEEASLIWQVFPNLKDVLLEEKENNYTTIVLKTNLTFKGNLKVKPKQTTEYILALVGEHAQTRCKHKVEVVDAFFGGQKFVLPNEKTNLTWRVAEGAKRIYLTKEKNGEKIIIKDNLVAEGNLEVTPEDDKNVFHLHIEFPYHESSYPHTILKRDKISLSKNNKTKKDNNAHGYHLKGAESIEHSYMYDSENEPQLVEGFEKVAINFDFFSEKIDKNYEEDLEKILYFLNKHPSSIVSIVGHSDLKGTSKGCLTISQKRAELTKKYLISKGVPEYRLITQSAGRTEPIYYQEKNEEQARANRRVEISVLE